MHKCAADLVQLLAAATLLPQGRCHDDRYAARCSTLTGRLETTPGRRLTCCEPLRAQRSALVSTRKLIVFQGRYSLLSRGDLGAIMSRAHCVYLHSLFSLLCPLGRFHVKVNGLPVSPRYFGRVDKTRSLFVRLRTATVCKPGRNRSELYPEQTGLPR
jgi:hypothetical protein